MKTNTSKCIYENKSNKEEEKAEEKAEEALKLNQDQDNNQSLKIHQVNNPVYYNYTNQRNLDNFSEENMFMSENVVFVITDILQDKFNHNNNRLFLNFNAVERFFVFMFLLRKKKKHKNWCEKKIKNISLNELVYFINGFKEFTSVKRFEEEFKFLFKYAIQYLKKELETNKLIRYHKKDIFLYQYYFEEIAVKMGISIDYFMDPSIVRKNKQKSIKTFGLKYLKILLSSEKFKMDFVNFILKNIEKVYLIKIKAKLRTILNWLKERNEFKDFQITKNENNSFKNSNFQNEKEKLIEEKKLEIIINYLIYNNQCKLPWSLNEIKTARIRVIKKIEKLSAN